jgi:plasmid stabilization system protein ParE
MAVIVLPDAQEDLISLQEYMLNKWGEADWLKAEDEIFDKLVLVDTGFFFDWGACSGACIGWHL